jgi:MoxR-like ATPase
VNSPTNRDPAAESEANASPIHDPRRAAAGTAPPRTAPRTPTDGTTPHAPPPPTAQTTRAADKAVSRTAEAAQRVLAEVEKAVVGKREVLELVLAGLLADGHVLLDDVPGVAKTLIARSLATVAGLEFSRVQFTPDVLPADITGATVLDLATNRPIFRPGPVFAQLVLADEINRAPAKTQAALLEAMQERQVTADGTTHRLPRPFLVIATQNPIESEGTYPLPEAQLDRFLLRTVVGYPAAHEEVEILSRRLARKQDEVELATVVTATEFSSMQSTLEHVYIDTGLREYAVALVTATRENGQLEVGSSPRGSLALLKLARARAVLAGRDFVTPDDVRAIAVPALAHRVVLRAEVWARRVSSDQVMHEIIDRVPAPSWR